MRKVLNILNRWPFDFQDLDSPALALPNIAAVYMVLSVDKVGNWTVLDVGESGQLNDRIKNHDRKILWRLFCMNETILIGFFRTPVILYSKDDRLEIEKEIRTKLQPLCGDR